MPVPPEHYKAVAQVIGYVMRLQGKLPRSRGLIRRINFSRRTAEQRSQAPKI